MKRVRIHTLSITAVGLVFALLAATAWLACTKRAPLDPVESVQDNVTLLAHMQATPEQVMTGGQESIISVQLIREDGSPVTGEQVTFSTTSGQITASATTDNDGWAQATLVSGTASGGAVITARHGTTLYSQVTVMFISGEEALLRVETADDYLLANGIDSTRITVTVVGDSAQPVVGAILSFSTSAGKITRSVITGEDGKAVAGLVSAASAVDLTAMVTVSNDSLSAQTLVHFTGVTVTASADPTSILTGGQNTSTIAVQVKETTSNIAVSNAALVFSTDLGTIPNAGVTNISGVAEVDLTSGSTPGVAHVIARYGKTLSDTVEVAFTEESSGNALLKDLTVSETAILANGVSQTVISGRVSDSRGNAVTGQAVNFTASAGTIPATIVTGASGIVQATLTSAASRTDIPATVVVRMGSQSDTLHVLFEGVKSQFTALPGTILADGVSTSTLTYILKKTGTNEAVPNGEIHFGATEGTIPASAITNTSGIAQAVLQSSGTPSVSQIVATYGHSLKDTVQVTFSDEAPTQYVLQTLSASSHSVLANGQDKLTVSAAVTDDKGSPVSGVSVLFYATSGSMASSATTGANGLANAELTAAASQTNIDAVVYARLDQHSIDSVNVVFEGVTLSLSASPDSILADARSVSRISAILKKTQTNIAIPSQTISFGTDLGTIPSSAITNISGLAEVDLTSISTIGTAHVTATYAGMTPQTIQVRFQESQPHYLQLTASPPVLTADGQSQSTIKASVSDVNHNPVPDGTTVTFSLDGSGTLQGTQKQTVTGVATNFLTAGTKPDSAWIRVKAGTLTDSIKVQYRVGAADQVIVEADSSRLRADGQSTAVVTARVLDAQGTPIEDATVNFTSTIGDITPTAQTGSGGEATASFTSGSVGTATITATVEIAGGGSVSGHTTIILVPGAPNSIVLSFNPTAIGVRETGQNQTAIIQAEVRDAKNNPVEDGTMVTFSIIHGPGGGEALSPTTPIPTVGGKARVSISSGTISGNVRVQAQTTGVSGSIIAKASEILIHAGPPYMEDRNDPTTTHLTIAADQLNIWRTLGETTVSIAVYDKYHNPVQENTAVYLTASGGGISTHTAYTDALGRAQVVLTGANPQPTITNYYYGELMQDPNDASHILPGPVAYSDLSSAWLLPNFDGDFTSGYPATLNGTVGNSINGYFGSFPRYNGISADSADYLNCENDGIARVIAYTEGQDASGDSVRAWHEITVVYSGAVGYSDNPLTTMVGQDLAPGESAVLVFTLIDNNGNPIESGSSIKLGLTNDVDAKLSWTEIETGDGWGTGHYAVTISNVVDPAKPQDAKVGPTAITIQWTGDHQYGAATSSGWVTITNGT
ncbi:Ig-like domain-containing protein [bacterium]|nr:Ig-like domain-containing protein [bacterium]